MSELADFTAKLEDINHRDECILEFIENAKANLEIKEITPKILKTFITRIEVYEKPEKYSRTCGNLVLIHYTFPSLNKSEPMLSPTADKPFAKAAC